MQNVPALPGWSGQVEVHASVQNPAAAQVPPA
jgi:hypothetical protein